MLGALLFLMTAAATSADPPLTDGVSGAPVAWSEWLPRKAPVAMLVWASWAPNSAQTMADINRLEQACSEAGFGLVVLDVQETLDDARIALAGREVAWIHDRHGALLKHYRVIAVPSLLLLDADRIVARLDPTPEAVRAWAAR